MPSLKILKKKIKKAKEDPREALTFVLSLIRGQYITLKTKITHPRVKIGPLFRARSNITFKGPGKIILGKNVTADLSFLRTPSIITHTSESSVTIGDGCYLGGTRISCVTSINIAPEGLLGSSTIIDSDIIPTTAMKIDDDWKAEHAGPIEIGSHFWSGTNAFVLKNTKMGDECVLGAGALVHNKTYPDKSLLIGNPARKIGNTR